MKELKGNISALSKRLGDLDSAIDRRKQYPRQYCLLLHGLEEESNRNTDQRVIDVSNESMGEPIRYLFKILRKSSDSLEKKWNGKSRPVIVTFILYNTRYLTYKNRKNLKWSRFRVRVGFCFYMFILALLFVFGSKIDLLFFNLCILGKYL